MLCISRYTDDVYAQYFGDGRHKFYVEFRCNRPCLKGMNCCAKCAEKTSTKLQQSRKFNHRNVNESIPDDSHIYGGKWYIDGCRKWGSPPSEIIEFAIQHQKDARKEFLLDDSVANELYKEEKQYSTQEMSCNKKTEIPIKRGRKPKVAPIESEQDNKLKVIKRKPKIASEDVSLISNNETNKQTKSRKINTATSYTSLINDINQMVYKEVSLPTHIESKLEEIDTSEFKIEYIKLSLFEVNNTTYFRDSTKNKLYKKIKEKGIGSYVGRWNPDTEQIITNIPDSDEE